MQPERHLEHKLKSVDRTSNRIASRRLQRALVLLNRAGQQFDAASSAATTRQDREHLRSLASGIRELYIPLSKTASRLEREGSL